MKKRKTRLGEKQNDFGAKISQKKGHSLSVHSWTKFETGQLNFELLRVKRAILVVFGSNRANFVWKHDNAEALLQADGVSATDGAKMLPTPKMAGNCENDSWFGLIRSKRPLVGLRHAKYTGEKRQKFLPKQKSTTLRIPR